MYLHVPICGFLFTSSNFRSQHEAQQVFSAKHPIEKDPVKTKVCICRGTHKFWVGENMGNVNGYLLHMSIA